MYYTVIKHDGHLRTRGKCRKHEPQASVFYISRVFSNVRSVLSQCNTRLRLLHLLYDIHAQNNKTRLFYVLYSDKTWVFDQSERAQGPIYIIKQDKSTNATSESPRLLSRVRASILTKNFCYSDNFADISCVQLRC